MKLISIIILFFLSLQGYNQTAVEYFNNGNKKLGQLDYKGSLVDFNNAIELNPKLKESYVNRGLIKEKLGDSIGAMSDYTNAILIYSKFTVAYYNRGFLKQNLLNYRGAIEDYLKAIETNPKFESYPLHQPRHFLFNNAA